MKRFLRITAGLSVLCIFSCTERAGIEENSVGLQRRVGTPNGPVLFTLLDGKHTGIDFANELSETIEHSMFDYDYFYNGSGVAIGDLNNDGLPDLFFTANMSSNRLYLNKGNLQFEDATKQAGVVSKNVWSNGVTLVDINQDGYLDIYVCNSYNLNEPKKRANFLYINQGNGTFLEQAEKYGLADQGFSVQSAFFDYDKDGDLDMYLSSHMIDFRDNFTTRMKNATEYTTDKLYRNKGDGTFEDVTVAAGITNYGCGLGVAIGDLNGDSWPDVYVGNDYEEPDFYYLNNGDGTFSESMQKYFKHTAMFSMGTTLSDYNNDGLLDVISLDMVAEDNFRQKTMMASMDIAKFWRVVNTGYYYQYMRNVLQLNNGNGSFSEISYLAGIANTDWSWAPLVADFDNDGWKDLYITNGFLRNFRNKDAQKRVDKFTAENKGANGKIKPELFDSIMNMYPSQRVINYYYRNNRDLTFTDFSGEAGINTPSFSNGASYADLDLDGDLDLVVNNLVDPAFIYRNNAREESFGNYLRIKLKGPAGNASGLGAKVTLTVGENTFFDEASVSRGYLSAVEDILHFGVGQATTIDLMQVIWPDGKMQELGPLDANQVIALNYSEAKNQPSKKQIDLPLLTDITDKTKVDFVHTENVFNDFATEILLPHRMSQFGPALAGGDVNGDGLEDLYIGGAKEQTGALYFQQKNGTFVRAENNVWESDKLLEDVGALFFDADGDADLDLYVASGGNEGTAYSRDFQDRLYINDGTGKFLKTDGALPEVNASSSCVVPGDFDKDGDMDLFVGGRQHPQKYPFAARSYILKNDGGKFTDVTMDVAPALYKPGMITSAVWTDFDKDGALDLITAGEWMPVIAYRNNKGTLEDVTSPTDLAKNVGWWNKIVAADLDGDGDDDFVVGNLGLNYKYKASHEEPFHVYCHDFDGSGTLDIVLGYFNQGECFPVRGRQCSSEQMPNIQEKFPTYHAFGAATLKDVYGEQLDAALGYKATYFSSIWMENLGGGNFETHALPLQAQFSTINGILVQDFDGDGNLDILCAGNFYVSEIETGRADASIGLLLTGDGNGNFKPISVSKSGFFANGDVRNMIQLSTGKGQEPLVVVGNNNAAVQVFRKNSKSPAIIAAVVK